MQNFLSLWLNTGAEITHGGQVQRPRQKNGGRTINQFQQIHWPSKTLSLSFVKLDGSIFNKTTWCQKLNFLYAAKLCIFHLSFSSLGLGYSCACVLATCCELRTQVVIRLGIPINSKNMLKCPPPPLQHTPESRNFEIHTQRDVRLLYFTKATNEIS